MSDCEPLVADLQTTASRAEEALHLAGRAAPCEPDPVAVGWARAVRGPDVYRPRRSWHSPREPLTLTLPAASGTSGRLSGGPPRRPWTVQDILRLGTLLSALAVRSTTIPTPPFRRPAALEGRPCRRCVRGRHGDLDTTPPTRFRRHRQECGPSRFPCFSSTSHVATSTNFMLVCWEDSTSIANACAGPISKRSMRMPLA